MYSVLVSSAIHKFITEFVILSDTGNALSFSSKKPWIVGKYDDALILLFLNKNGTVKLGDMNVSKISEDGLM